MSLTNSPAKDHDDVQRLQLQLLMKDNEIKALKLKVNPNTEIDRLNNELQILKDQYDADISLLKEENQEYADLLQQMQEQTEYLKQAVIAKEKEINDLRQVGTTNEDMENLRSQLRALQLKSRSGELQLALADNTNLRNDLQILQTKLEDHYLSKQIMEEQISNLGQMLEIEQRSTLNQANQISTLQKEAQYLRNSVNDRERFIQGKDKMIKLKDSEISKLQDAIADIMQKLREAQHDNSVIVAQNDQQHKHLQERDQEIDSLKDQIKFFAEDLQKLQHFEKQYQDIAKLNSGLNEQIKELAAQKKELRAQFEAQIEELKAKHENEINYRDARIHELEKEVQSLQDLLDESKR